MSSTRKAAPRAGVHGPDIDAYKRWKPEAQQRALSRLREAQNADWHPFYCLNNKCNGQPHCWPVDTRECPWPYGHIWKNEDEDGSTVDWYCKYCGVGGVLLDEWGFYHARTDQRPPRWMADWLTLFLRGGRGSGKTRTGSEITNRVSDITPQIILVGATGPDLRETMVEGRSGILATAPPGKRPTWEPSRKRLTWPNGCVGRGFSAEEPDRLRGPESGFIWADEPSHWALVEECWDNMLYGHRIKAKGAGAKPKIVATSTPKPNKWTKEQVAEPDTVDRVVPTMANEHALAETFKRKVIDRFAGTRRGRQELEGLILEDVEGALWKYEMMQWVPEAPALQRIVIGVDPAGTANKKSDETGIVTVGIGFDKCLYVLDDKTDKYSPERWGNMVNGRYEFYSADAIVPEKTYGQDMVMFVLENAGYTGARIIGVNSRRGKALRAEPIVALYEKKRVFHVGERGDLLELEEEMTSWVPSENSPSPNRVDALVHACTELAKVAMPVVIADPGKILAGTSVPRLRAV